MKLLLTFLLLLFPLSAYSQNDPPSLKPLQQGLKAGWFSRMDGEFIVEIPVDVESTEQGLQDSDKELGLGNGRAHKWLIKQGGLQISYYKLPKNISSDKDKQALLELIKRRAADAFVDPKFQHIPGEYTPGKSDVISNSYMRPSNNAAIIVRNLIYKDRLYEVMAVYFRTEQYDAGLRFVNSFRLVDKEKIAEMRIEAAMPEPLPQTPAIKYPKSDAEDLGLKGKVKVFYETLKPAVGSPDALLAGRKDEVRFNSDGYLLSWIQYQSGEPFSVTVFGYIDGKRVTKNVYIPRDAAPAGAAVKPPPTGPEAPRDMRYNESFVNKYDERGLLAEVFNYTNNGTLQLRSVITRNGSTVKQINFDGAGKLTSQSIDTLGKRGELLESTLKWLNTEHDGYTIVYKYAGFDAQGNWIERTQSTKKIMNGKVTLSPVQTETRRIEYY